MLDHLNKKTLELIQRRNSNDITFNGTIADCDPKKAKNADIMAPFQVLYGDLRRAFTLAAQGGYKYAGKITDRPLLQVDPLLPALR